MIWGDLPTANELQKFEEEVQMHRRVSFRIRDMLKCFPESGHPMDALQASAASLGLFYSRRAIDNPKYIYDAVVRLIAKIPTMVAAFEQIRKGDDPIQPQDDLPYSSNFWSSFAVGSSPHINRNAVSRKLLFWASSDIG